MKKKFLVGIVLSVSLFVWGCGGDEIISAEPEIVQLKDDLVALEADLSEGLEGMHESSPEVLDCYFAESVLKNGEGQLFYAQEAVLSGKKCAHTAQERVCDNGILSGNVEFKFETCVEGGIAAVENAGTEAMRPVVRKKVEPRVITEEIVSTPEVKNCEMGDVILEDGESSVFYKRSEVESFMRCEDFSKERICKNGILEGDDVYDEIECRVKEVIVPIPRGGCILDGVILGYGESAIFYSKKEVISGLGCAKYSVERVCHNGRLSGSNTYHYASCVE